MGTLGSSQANFPPLGTIGSGQCNLPPTGTLGSVNLASHPPPPTATIGSGHFVAHHGHCPVPPTATLSSGQWPSPPTGTLNSVHAASACDGSPLPPTANMSRSHTNTPSHPPPPPTGSIGNGSFRAPPVGTIASMDAGALASLQACGHVSSSHIAQQRHASATLGSSPRVSTAPSGHDSMVAHLVGAEARHPSPPTGTTGNGSCSGRFVAPSSAASGSDCLPTSLPCSAVAHTLPIGSRSHQPPLTGSLRSGRLTDDINDLHRNFAGSQVRSTSQPVTFPRRARHEGCSTPPAASFHRSHDHRFVKGSAGAGARSCSADDPAVDADGYLSSHPRGNSSSADGQDPSLSPTSRPSEAVHLGHERVDPREQRKQRREAARSRGAGAAGTPPSPTTGTTEGSNALHHGGTDKDDRRYVIGILGLQGLDEADRRLRPLCVCRGPGAVQLGLRLRTPPWHGAGDPAWRYEQELPAESLGDLEFCVLAAGAARKVDDYLDESELIGKAPLKLAQFQRYGYEGALSLYCPGRGIRGLLYIRVSLLSKRDGGAGRQRAAGGATAAGSRALGADGYAGGLATGVARNGERLWPLGVGVPGPARTTDALLLSDRSRALMAPNIPTASTAEHLRPRLLYPERRASAAVREPRRTENAYEPPRRIIEVFSNADAQSEGVDPTVTADVGELTRSPARSHGELDELSRSVPAADEDRALTGTRLDRSTRSVGISSARSLGGLDAIAQARSSGASLADVNRGQRGRAVSARGSEDRMSLPLRPASVVMASGGMPSSASMPASIAGSRVSAVPVRSATIGQDDIAQFKDPMLQPMRPALGSHTQFMSSYGSVGSFVPTPKDVARSTSSSARAIPGSQDQRLHSASLPCSGTVSAVHTPHNPYPLSSRDSSGSLAQTMPHLSGVIASMPKEQHAGNVSIPMSSLASVDSFVPTPKTQPQTGVPISSMPSQHIDSASRNAAQNPMLMPMRAAGTGTQIMSSCGSVDSFVPTPQNAMRAGASPAAQHHQAPVQHPMAQPMNVVAAGTSIPMSSLGSVDSFVPSPTGCALPGSLPPRPTHPGQVSMPLPPKMSTGSSLASAVSPSGGSPSGLPVGVSIPLLTTAAH
eukprot:TRINITY_DN4711_c0_g11_i1.p1 TRINITY_DN4711_c0_g11~~TRINITY_DN4711_c0_g11_i1.p1  ORF type:complete len:1266 (+),score=123.82 TRINITY_DN4711_c0_g11_i1:482-3799(+)